MANQSVSHAYARAQSPIIHPVWAVLAIPALALLLFSDVSNNLSIVDMFATGKLSLMSWQSLSVGVALAAGVLGYAASRKAWYWFPCILVTVISGSLTMISVGTDFKTQSAGADSYEVTKQGLILEREQLLNSLNGTPPCSAQRWCDSQAKERRVAAINHELATTAPKVDPIATPHGEIFAQAIAWLRAFGIPLITSILGNLLGEIFKGSRQTTPTPPNDGSKKRISEYDWQDTPAPQQSPRSTMQPVTANATNDGFTERFHEEKEQLNAPNQVQDLKRTRKPTDRATQGLQRDTGTFGKAKNRYSELRKSVLAGRTRPSIRQVRSFSGCNQEVAERYLNQLEGEGVIQRLPNGRYSLVAENEKGRALRLVK